ncbi:MAG TPA: UDP-3-O-(3-hydroxymyristoyl)glucosamine N-acyltransferase [Candidatus Nitrosotalea sp.]|nr:UDP-3-O-(3-hydroxymyristoyl)glucosamine N-acyltransferase [Candidatus Nitrosotalea sp.]
MVRRITTVSRVVKFVKTGDSAVHGKDKEAPITGFKPISSAGRGEMAFCVASGERGEKLVRTSKASLIICPPDLKKRLKGAAPNLIFVENPRLWFIRCLRNFTQADKLVGIHPTAVLESKKLGSGVYIGPYTYIGKNVSIGNNVVIRGGVHIYGNTKIGNNVIIDSSTVIGGDGFGFEKNEIGAWEKFPHLGWVEIHDNVEIGANVCIDRGTLEGTIIREGTKIDNLVHVSHNVKIGRNCIVVAQSFLGGSCILEDNAYIAMGVVVRDGVRMGTNALVGMGAVVIDDVEKNTTVIGVPARPMKKKSR